MLLQCVACVAVCYDVLQCAAMGRDTVGGQQVMLLQCVACVAVIYDVLQCVAVCCSVLQCVAVCCSVLQLCGNGSQPLLAQ